MIDLYAMSVDQFKAYLAELQATPCPECGKVEPKASSLKEILACSLHPPVPAQPGKLSQADLDAFLTSLYQSDPGPSCPGCRAKQDYREMLVFERLPIDMMREAPELWQAIEEANKP